MTTLTIKKITVFCGSSRGSSSIYAEITKQLADLFCKFNISLVYGGANVGLMGVLANRMLTHNSEVIGIIPQSLVDVEIAHPNLTKSYIVNSMHERKALMEKLSDACIMLPGSTGTLEEFSEMFTWAQLGYHSKPCAILNINHYYDDFLKYLDHSVQEGFLKQVFRDMLIIDSLPEKLMEKIFKFQAPKEKKWIRNITDKKVIKI